MSGCPLNAPVQDLVLPLAYCGHLGSIIAVNCGLYGGVPNLDPLPPSRINGEKWTSWRSKLASSLEVLRLSGNNLSHMDAIPPSTRKLVVSSNKQPLRLADGALTSALQHQVFIDLRGTTLHEDTHQEAQKLWGNDVIQRTATFQPRHNNNLARSPVFFFRKSFFFRRSFKHSMEKHEKAKSETPSLKTLAPKTIPAH